MGSGKGQNKRVNTISSVTTADGKKINFRDFKHDPQKSRRWEENINSLKIIYDVYVAKNLGRVIVDTEENMNSKFFMDVYGPTAVARLAFATSHGGSEEMEVKDVFDGMYRILSAADKDPLGSSSCANGPVAIWEHFFDNKTKKPFFRLSASNEQEEGKWITFTPSQFHGLYQLIDKLSDRMAIAQEKSGVLDLKEPHPLHNQNINF